MLSLNRIQVGEFNIEKAISIEELEKIANKDRHILEEKMIKVEDIFKENKSVNLDSRKLELFLNGVKIILKDEDGVYKIYHNSEFVGTGIVKDGLLKRDIVC